MAGPGFQKGGKGGPGRPRGSRNKAPQALKEMILQALSEAGGVDYLLRQARKKNALPFLQLVGRVLPLQVKDGGADPIVPKPIYHERID